MLLYVFAFPPCVQPPPHGEFTLKGAAMISFDELKNAFEDVALPARWESLASSLAEDATAFLSEVSLRRFHKE